MPMTRISFDHYWLHFHKKARAFRLVPSDHQSPTIGLLDLSMPSVVIVVAGQRTHYSAVAVRRNRTIELEAAAVGGVKCYIDLAAAVAADRSRYCNVVQREGNRCQR